MTDQRRSGSKYVTPQGFAAIRDGILLVSGRLIDSSGGPSLPLEYEENTGGLTGNVNPPAFALRKFRVEQEFERTVYLPIVRAKPQAGPAQLREVFDFTQPATFAGMRSQTVGLDNNGIPGVARGGAITS
ncbi:MAG: hypothetical protein EBR15_10330, partial [Gammaproteobacteria bacterium]|nr:hypothetical protein [Gammaproteobacteria bacterium]